MSSQLKLGFSSGCRYSIASKLRDCPISQNRPRSRYDPPLVSFVLDLPSRLQIDFVLYRKLPLENLNATVRLLALTILNTPDNRWLQ